ncbi:MAG: RNA polymerase sigma factor [Nitrososphaerota archaeon]
MLESPSRLFPAASMAGDQADADTLLSEQALMEAAKHDPTAFAALYQRYFARVYRYLRMRLQSEEDAADLTQQVFLKALDALPRYQPRSTPVAAWLFTIARNTLIDRFRRQQATLPLEAANDVLAEHEMEAIVLRREAFEQLRALLSTLNAEARDLLALRFAAGLTTPEIADILGKRPEAVRKSLSRLLHTLKEQYHATR